MFTLLLSERSWLERGHKVGEHVIPLARNFNGMSIDIEEPGSNNIVCLLLYLKLLCLVSKHAVNFAGAHFRVPLYFIVYPSFLTDIIDY